MRDLNEIINEARYKRYKLGEHDCALFAINTIKEIHGIDYGENIRGCYFSRFGYLRLWKSFGCRTMKEMVRVITKKRTQGMRRVKRGDLVLFLDDEKNEHLGICVGDKVAIVTLSDKLTFVDILDCSCCWRMGE